MLFRFIKAEAIKVASQYKLGPIFTPPIVAGTGGFRGVLGLPAATGGANWQGGAVDPETGMLYVASVTSPSVGSLVHDPKRNAMDYFGSFAPGPAVPNQQGCPGVNPSVMGLPIIKPPYGRITAYDMNKGEVAWQIANGDTPPAIKNHPKLAGLNIPRTGSTSHAGLLTTRTLLFEGEGDGGLPMFRALDKKTGQIVWETEIAAGPQTGLPMTYMHQGRQFVVFSAGGGPEIGRAHV